MFSEKGPRNTGEQNESQEQLNLERQKKKLVGFYLSEDEGNQFKYIFNSNEDEFNENRRLPEEEHLVKELLRNHYDEGLKQKERGLLVMMAGPDAGPDHRPLNLDSIGKIFEKIDGDKHQKRILGYIARGPEGWNSYENASASDVMRFLRKYETPIDFEKSSNELLAKVRASQTKGKYQEYCDAMEKFQLGVYGKKYEYYKAMKELYKEADEAAVNKPRTGKTEQIKPSFAEIFERDSVVKDAGLAMKNKNLTGGDEPWAKEFWAQNPNRPNEDAAYYNPRIGMFGVFDGAGGVRNAALASQLGKDAVIREVSERTPGTPDELKQILTVANGAVASEGGGGISTVVIGRILEKQGQKTLVWASAGDSRIYVVGKGTVERITTDETLEGYPNVITNGLGTKNFQVEYTGEYKLNDGDRIVFCSDGVTGDRGKDIMQDDELARIVRGAPDADMAAQELIRRARKFDDRTAIVVEV